MKPAPSSVTAVRIPTPREAAARKESVNVPDWVLRGVVDVIGTFTPRSGKRQFTVSQETVVGACMRHAPEGTERADGYRNNWFDIERDPRLSAQGWKVTFTKGYAFAHTESEFRFREASRPRGTKAHSFSRARVRLHRRRDEWRRVPSPRWWASALPQLG